ncbi:MAG: hypothetical protein V2B19_19325 [Pseudomonadota bacterium]
MKPLLHAQNMPIAIGDLVGKKMAEEYAKQLIEAQMVEHLLSELASCTQNGREQRVSSLD